MKKSISSFIFCGAFFIATALFGQEKATTTPAKTTVEPKKAEKVESVPEKVAISEKGAVKDQPAMKKACCSHGQTKTHSCGDKTQTAHAKDCTMPCCAGKTKEEKSTPVSD
ncbi:MAG: hypothetical protein HYY40_05365 [Bacteroidetes bacterium]|nr:hypothetical protein [Bacteroidota bacterium]